MQTQTEFIEGLLRAASPSTYLQQATTEQIDAALVYLLGNPNLASSARTREIWKALGAAKTRIGKTKEATDLSSIAREVRRLTEDRDEAWAGMNAAQREYLSLTGWVTCGYDRYTHEKHPGIHELEEAYSIERKTIQESTGNG